jgi:diaminohydroxyphosphoribosylaminopyrimidine deaminase/5-amino-6-(5-phosphoribosylamino)uracil reductase
MRRALALAEQGRFTAHPNPMVGCVIVRDGKIVGEGWHQQPGTPHAEVHALHQAGTLAAGSDVYINLEPCSHIGRTPPCVDALIKANVRRVIIPFADPNPRVKGTGIQRLQAAEIEVVTGIEVEAAAALNRTFLYAMQHERPYVIAKWAMTLDGQLSMAAPAQRWITGEIARAHVHQHRAQVDAVIVGANTVRADNPYLTARLSDPDLQAKIKQPLRVILSHQGNIPFHSHIIAETMPGKTWVVTAVPVQNPHTSSTVEWIHLPAATQTEAVDLNALLHRLFQQDVMSVIVEGGSCVLEQFFAADLVNEVHLYLALKQSGHMQQGVGFLPQELPWHLVESMQLGNDIFVRCWVNSEKEPLHV